MDAGGVENGSATPRAARPLTTLSRCSAVGFAEVFTSSLRESRIVWLLLLANIGDLFF